MKNLFNKIKVFFAMCLLALVFVGSAESQEGQSGGTDRNINELISSSQALIDEISDSEFCLEDEKDKKKKIKEIKKKIKEIEEALEDPDILPAVKKKLEEILKDLKDALKKLEDGEC